MFNLDLIWITDDRDQALNPVPLFLRSISYASNHKLQNTRMRSHRKIALLLELCQSGLASYVTLKFLREFNNLEHVETEKSRQECPQSPISRLFQGISRCAARQLVLMVGRIPVRSISSRSLSLPAHSPTPNPHEYNPSPEIY